jgi:2-hydroxychromene-2-carboxylate isomerase
MTITDPAPGAVQFYFDPGCPWTWMTSRWVTEVAAARDFEVIWRTFSLGIVNENREVPEQYKSVIAASIGALRIIESLRAEGNNARIGEFYTELGTRWHAGDEPRTTETVVAAAEKVGIANGPDIIADESWTKTLRESLAEAKGMAGDDIGSPVLAIGDRAMFGPIVSPPPTGDTALAVWDAVNTLIATDEVAEIKRGRPSRPGDRR